MSVVSRAPARSLVYQPALDGLRGLAVLMVMLYHHHPLLDGGPFRGGYIGVDIFFVLSGFLITWLLLDERSSSGSIRVGRFWGRRARRLVPALLAMLVLVALLDRFAYPEALQPLIRADVPWALSYLENWHIALAGGLSISPLAHTWSLGVEEQWYLLWPVALPMLFVLSAKRPRRLLGIVMGIAIAIAVATPLLFDSSRSGRVFFGTDFRAQELLIGGALAVSCALISSGSGRPAGPLMNVAGAAALAMIGAWAVAGPSSLPGFRGGYLGVAVVVATVIAAAVRPKSWVRSALSRQWLIATGRISYGLYLYHLPIYRWLNPSATGLDGVRLLVLRLAVTTAVAIASFKWIEQPIRRRHRTGTPLLALGAVVAVAIIAATSIGVASPIPLPRSSRLAFLLGYTAGTTSEGTTRVLVLGGEEAAILTSTTFGPYQGDRRQGVAVGKAGCGFTSTARRCADVTGDVAALTNAYRARWVVLLPSELDLSRLAHARSGSKLISRFDHAIENLPSRRVTVVIAACKTNASSPRGLANERLRSWARRRGVGVVPLGDPQCPQTAPAPTLRWPALVKALWK